MLILTRKEGEEIIIGDVVIKVVETRQHKVRLGVVAPKEMGVYRREVYEQIVGKAPPEIDELYKDLGGEGGGA